MADRYKTDWYVVADDFGYKNIVVDRATGKNVAMTKTYYHTAVEMEKHANLVAAAPEMFICLVQAKWLLENGGEWSIEDQADMGRAINKAMGK